MVQSTEVVKVLIVGAGTSAGVPKLACVACQAPGEGIACEVCRDAFENGWSSRNHRLNPSLLLIVEAADGEQRCILVDCGKTFRESMMKVLPAHQISSLHSVLLTHEHADAVHGIDDLREFSSKERPLRVYADAKTETYLRQMYPYLFSAENKSWVASIDWRPLCAAERGSGQGVDEAPQVPLHWTLDEVEGLRLGVVPVIHHLHARSTCNAFVFPLTGGGVLLYISDIVELTDEAVSSFATLTQELGGRAEPRAEIVVLDMLGVKENTVHFTVDQALAAARRLNARQTVFIGMSCSLDFHKQSELVRGVDPSFACGYDGMVLFERKRQV